jgi:hypothetical protein
MSNQLFENAVKACKSAMSLSNETEALTKHLETLQGETVSAVEIACAESYAWFISVNRKHGAKQDLATASGVSGKTIGRWIASGHVALVTEGKATASQVNSAIGNYSMKIAEVEKVQTLTEWRNLLKAYKAVNKSGAGKVVGKAETTEATEATEATPKATAKGWKSHAENLAKSIESGEVGLMEVMDYMTELVSNLGLSIDDMEEIAI